MGKAQKRDAVHTEKFFFRKNVLPPGYRSPTISTPASSGSSSPVDWNDGAPPKERKMRNCFPRVARPSVLVDNPVEDEYEEMSMEEIFTGKGSEFPGLLGLVEAYIETLDMEPSEKRQIEKYLDLVRRRANGSLQTSATWIRNFVRSHPLYKFDSVVSQEINYDLMVAVDELERGVLRVPELLPEDYSRPHVNGLHESKFEP
ncbi:hypothetical protein PAXINDRAFT_103617 [Paxillus involutus ATCC 200175]|uniref:Glutamate--cysteine ligase n=1 Tax=Paxillus involutus ATCC 200175 TaxID=664439 RepID=A0A0C9T2T9_PAXIN|nr:hypothetical protein PAXINDRAFT_103617 [Paxillus involutus ATCC 200175]